MRVQIQLRIITDDENVLSDDVIACFDKGDDQLEEIGLSLDQAKSVLASAQTRLVAAQAANFLARHRGCELCGRHLQSKGRCRILFRTAFGTIPLVSPRVHRCACQPATSKTFSPLTALFTGHTAPELLYLETRWASLVSFGLTAGLLKDVLPVDARTNAAAIRNHLHKVALRQEAELGDERPHFVNPHHASTKCFSWNGILPSRRTLKLVRTCNRPLRAALTEGALPTGPSENVQTRTDPQRVAQVRLCLTQPRPGQGSGQEG